MKIQDYYLDYLNNFLTLEKFAEHYGISVDLATLLVKEGRIKHEMSVGGYSSLPTTSQRYFDEKMSY